MRTKQLKVLAVLRSMANKGGNSKWVLASTVAKRIQEKAPETVFVRGEIQTLLSKLKASELVVSQKTKKTNGKDTRGRKPAYEWAITDKGRRFISEIVDLSKS